MESNNITSKVGGYSPQNLKDSSIFFAKKDRPIKLSFRLDSFSIINDLELMKIILNKKYISRLMKYLDEETNQPSIVVDIIDIEKDEIIYKANKIFYNGVGLGGFLFEYNYITQWEIVPFDKITRSFLVGNKNDFLETIEIYNIKLNQDADWYIKNELE